MASRRRRLRVRSRAPSSSSPSGKPNRVRAPVDGQHVPRLVQQDQPLVHAVQNQAHLVPLCGDGLDIAAQTLHQLVNVAQDGAQLVVGLVVLQPGGAGAVQHALEGAAHGAEWGHHPVGGAAGQNQGQQQSGRRGDEEAPYAVPHQAVDGGQGAWEARPTMPSAKRLDT